MTHLTLDQLMQLREPGLEPGIAAHRAHLEACEQCRAEAVLIEQRANRLRALRSLRPARDYWPQLEQRLRAERRSQVVRRVVWVGLAVAAGLGAVVAVRILRPAPQVEQQLALEEAMAKSQQLEQVIHSYNPDARVTDGQTVRVTGELEERIALVDQQLMSVRQLGSRRRETEMLDLWRQRVGLLNALVDVHMTRATAVGY